MSQRSYICYERTSVNTETKGILNGTFPIINLLELYDVVLNQAYRWLKNIPRKSDTNSNSIIHKGENIEICEH